MEGHGHPGRALPQRLGSECPRRTFGKPKRAGALAPGRALPGGRAGRVRTGFETVSPISGKPPGRQLSDRKDIALQGDGDGGKAPTHRHGLGSVHIFDAEGPQAGRRAAPVPQRANAEKG